MGGSLHRPLAAAVLVFNFCSRVDLGITAAVEFRAVVARPGTTEGARPGTTEGARPGPTEGVRPGTEVAKPGTTDGAIPGIEAAIPGTEAVGPDIEAVIGPAIGIRLDGSKVDALSDFVTTKSCLNRLH